MRVWAAPIPAPPGSNAPPPGLGAPSPQGCSPDAETLVSAPGLPNLSCQHPPRPRSPQCLPSQGCSMIRLTRFHPQEPPSSSLFWGLGCVLGARLGLPLQQGPNRRPADSQPLICPQHGTGTCRQSSRCQGPPRPRSLPPAAGRGAMEGKPGCCPEQPSATRSHLALPAQLWPGVQVPTLHVYPLPVLPPGGAL